MSEAPAPYRVLARKYRPTRFEELIGQDAMVRTLGNAIAQGRIAHAFVMTGVRGVGKTSTARLIARALNCVGPDGKGRPTLDPCGACEHCRAIAEDRHVDVLEMDAASRTGVEDIRDLIDGVRYRPVSARHKVYIVDEVHMLSEKAFNALLKTLEEPPPQVIFVFATTEIRKVPVTVLSRCQRFDLRRIDAATLIAHLTAICGKEKVTAEPEALALIARAAEGSVRDALSLLDQAIAHGNAAVAAKPVRDMLGLADRERVIDLYEAVMAGKVEAALGLLRAQYDLGVEPGVVLQDMLDFTHFLTRLKLVQEVATDVTLSEGERTRGAELARKLGVPVLSRAWQMLLKGLGEARIAPSALAAAEMTLVRLCHVAELPTPGELVRRIESQPHSTAAPPATMPQTPPASRGSVAIQATPAVQPRPQPSVQPQTQARALPGPASFEAMVALAEQRKELRLVTELKYGVHLVAFEPGKIELRLADRAPADLPGRLMTRLQDWTGQRWTVVISDEDGQPTLADAEMSHKAGALTHPLVLSLLEHFPDAQLREVKLDKATAPEDEAALEEPSAEDLAAQFFGDDES
ncbi:MAG: DNA polymerase III subunit gamma/tau [Alphaproteobacteria bacterium]|nr:DNA polymerase III subunit gamma/tau [Alphaproteobacteria bacterium]